jgi:arabinoxylan arabinofuranohydrolase
MTGPSATGPVVLRRRDHGKEQRRQDHPPGHRRLQRQIYIFYHNAKLPGGGEFRRSVAVEELHYGADGTILPVAQTAQGPGGQPVARLQVIRK